MTKIAYICADPGIPVFGCKGSSVHVQEVVRAFIQADNEVVLFATRWGGDVPRDLRCVGLRPLPPLPRGRAEERARAALAGNAALRSALAAAGPFDLVYERYSLWSHAGIDYAREAAIPGILEVNAPLIEEQARHRELALPEEAERVARSVFAGAAALVAVSPGVAAYLDNYLEARGRIHVIENGIDPARFAPRDMSAGKAADGSFTVGFVGTLKPWHGLLTLIESCAVLKRDHGLRPDLLIVGDGPERARVEAEIAAHDLAETTRLAGAVPPERVPALLARTDIAAAPYPAMADFYFSPLKIYEYMAAGLPVVSSRVGHLDRVVRDGEDGLLCPPDDPPALAAAIARLARDPGLRRRLGRAGRTRVLRDHTWAAVAGRILLLAGLARHEAVMPARSSAA